MAETREQIFTGVAPEPISLYGMVEDSVVDGPGVRFTIFVQGCPHGCEGCHNKDAQDFGCGIAADIYKVAEKIIKSRVRKITFSGGEPFAQAAELARIARLVRAFKDIDVMTYTGYTFEELLEAAEHDDDMKDLLAETNYLVDGKFEQDKKSFNCFFRGSSNQRIFDITCYPNTKKARLIEKREDF